MHKRLTIYTTEVCVLNRELRGKFFLKNELLRLRV